MVRVAPITAQKLIAVRVNKKSENWSQSPRTESKETQPISKMFNSHKFLANTIWRKEKDKAIFHTGSSALQVRASEADIFPPFNTFLKKKN